MDVAIIGGGFYGSCLALYLKKAGANVELFERERKLLQRSSSINQSRVHTGFHYPRNLKTAFRSLINFPIFIKDFKKAIVTSNTNLYCVAKVGSNVNANQFYNLYKKMKAPIKIASPVYKKLFNDKLIEEVFEADEFVFDCEILQTILEKQLAEAKIHIHFETEVSSVKRKKNKLVIQTTHGGERCFDFAVNCTYARINKLLRDSGLECISLKHEITELVLVDTPDSLAKLGVTVMDGPFFSLMPYPSRGLHTLSHVRYTPHMSWEDETKVMDGYEILKTKPLTSRFPEMQRDAARFLSDCKDLTYVESLFEVKTVLIRHESDDGRPICCWMQPDFPDFLSVLGGKIDNIYDILLFLQTMRKKLKIKSVSLDTVFQ